MKKIKVIMSASLLAIAGTAVAEEPITLTTAQMDGVSAGAVVLLSGFGYAGATGDSFANLLGGTQTYTSVLADPTGALSGNMQVVSFGDSLSIATSVTDGGAIGGAAAYSDSTAFAQLQ